MAIRDYERSKYHFSQAIQIADKSKFGRSRVNAVKICLAAAKVMNKAKDIDSDTLYKYEPGNQIKLLNSSIARDIAAILLNIDDQHTFEAEHWIERAIEADRKNGMKWFLANYYALHAELFKQKGYKSKKQAMSALENYATIFYDGNSAKAELISKKKHLYYTVVYKDGKAILE